MLYSFTNQEKQIFLSSLKELEVRENDSPKLMAALNGISKDEARRRFAEDNKAFVAYWNGQPSAFGWMAMGKAQVGELNHEFILPEWHRYLWNFRTLPEFRGKGIYPRLLQFIIAAEKWTTECFWIMHAPENNASESGIRKAGFIPVSKVSIVDGREVILNVPKPSPELQKLIDYSGFRNSAKEQATCWNCSSPFIKNRREECCCTEKSLDCNASLFELPSIQQHSPHQPNSVSV